MPAYAPEEVDEVIFGQVAVRLDELCTPARGGSLLAGVPQEAAANAVIRGCGSAMQALIDATRAIRLGDSEVVVAGGVENMSQIPYYNDDMRWESACAAANSRTASPISSPTPTTV